MLDEVDTALKFAEDNNSLSGVFCPSDAPLVNLHDICSGYSLETSENGYESTSVEVICDVCHKPIFRDRLRPSGCQCREAGTLHVASRETPPVVLTRASTADDTASSSSQHTVIPARPPPKPSELATSYHTAETARVQPVHGPGPSTSSRTADVTGSTDDELEDSCQPDPMVATVLDVAVIRALLITHWQEQGIYWAMRYLLNRLEQIQIGLLSYSITTWENFQLKRDDDDRTKLHVAFNDSRIYLSLGCPHGCNEGVKSQQGDFLRVKAKTLLAQLEKLQQERFRTIFTNYVEENSPQQILDLIHSITAFCRSEFPPTLTPPNRPQLCPPRNLLVTPVDRYCDYVASSHDSVMKSGQDEVSDADSSPSTPRTASSIDDGLSPLVSAAMLKKKSAPKLHFAFNLLKSNKSDNMDEECSDSETADELSGIFEGVRRFAFLLETTRPGTFPDPPLIAALLHLIGDQLTRFIEVKESKERTVLKMEDSMEDFFDDGEKIVCGFEPVVNI
ncbi:hypothetical protein TELCIR_00893 [Teladorsagia circumcincta]|uniref:Protein UNC80 central region domain-containing protein n=1 Tax=Teladorsagia circumcincta TaxID=45464 RepID=A0A2G9V3D1_TELCI|nr:hypothetical protein TELCIR_00893 [Teladorsagia circumcincta]